MTGESVPLSVDTDVGVVRMGINCLHAWSISKNTLKLSKGDPVRHRKIPDKISSSGKIN